MIEATEKVMVGEAARRIGARPRDITELFYKGELRDDLCPIRCGRRMIPLYYLEMIVMALKRNRRPVGKVQWKGEPVCV